MCDGNSEDKDILQSKSTLLNNACAKCSGPAVIVVGTNGTYCKPCLQKQFTHKFRASMGRNPLVRHGEKVLIAYSGGSNSSALLHLVVEGLLPDMKKKLKFVPGVIFIDESVLYPSEDFVKEIQAITDNMKKTNFPHHIIKLEECMVVYSQENNPDSRDLAHQFTDLMNSVDTLTSKKELLYRLKCRLLSFKAKELCYQHLFLGETSTRLAVNILSNVALGRGIHLLQDTGYSDGNRFEEIGVKLLRPLRDITAKEVAVYNAMHNIETVFFKNLSTKQKSTSSIQSLTESFVMGLVANFPSTEMTIYRTSNKLIPSNHNSTVDDSKKCKICLGIMDTLTRSLDGTAYEQTKFTENLSKGKYGKPCDENVTINDEIQATPELCYACTILNKDMKTTNNSMASLGLNCKNDVNDENTASRS